MLQLVLEQRGVEVAVSLAGELRGAASPLHKKNRGEALGVRKDARKSMEGSSRRGGDGGDRNKQKTVAV